MKGVKRQGVAPVDVESTYAGDGAREKRISFEIGNLEGNAMILRDPSIAWVTWAWIS
jgi:hypothetical protein